MADNKEAKKRLGRGLAALIGEMDEPLPSRDGKQAAVPEASVRADRTVAIELVRANPNNPRRYFAEEHLDDLARSIAEHGIIQPILVRPVKGDDLAGAKFEVIAGERRWRAAQRAKLHEIPVLIRDVEDRQALELAIIENVQRADLNPVEEALGYQQLIDEYDYSQADLGQVIGKSRSHVANTLRLLKLPADVQKLVQDGALSAGHARSLVTAADPLAVARKIVAEGLSVRQAEELAQERHEPAEGKRATETKSFDFKSADLKALEQRIEDALGLKVDIRHKANDRGEIRLKYKSLDQLDEISRRLEQG